MAQRKSRGPSGGSAVAEKPASDPKQYSKEVTAAKKELIAIARAGDSSCWKHAVLANTQVALLLAGYSDYRTKEEIYNDLADGHPWGAKTIKKGAVCVANLNEADLEEVATDPRSGFTQVSDIVHSSIPTDAKFGLVREVYKHDKAHPDEPYTVQAVRGKIAELLEKDQTVKDWHRESDYWEFNDHDARFGQDGFAGRIPGQAVLNILDRWLPPGGVFLNAMCGSGTALDAAKYLKQTDKYYGFDLTPTERSLKKHGPERVFNFDAIDNVGHWNQIGIPNDEPVDLLLITPPHFSFGKGTARSGKPTDLGNISKPEDYLMVWNQILAGAKSVMRSGGVIAIVTKATSEFDDGTPVPDIEGQILQALTLHQLDDMFLGRPVIRVRKEGHPKSTGKDRKPYLIPEIQTVHIFRVTK